MSWSRRDFIATAVAGSVSSLALGQGSGDEPAKSGGSGKRPIIVCAGNGYEYLDPAFAFLKGGGDTLDAALKVVKGPEDDPNETA